MHILKKRVFLYVSNLSKLLFGFDIIDNHYYGHYSIFRKYTKTILPYLINGQVQHGWSPYNGLSCDTSEPNHEIKKRRFYVMNERNKKESQADGFHNVKAIGSPFLYIQNKEKYYVKEIPQSLIVFPIHTHEYFTFYNTYDTYKNYLKELQKITPNFKKITISLGWREYEDFNIVNLFKDVGFHVVSMGHRENNPSFLINFIKAVSEHEYASSDSFSTAIFYSLYMKKKTFVFGNSMTEVKGIGDYKKSLNHVFLEKYPELKWENFNHISHYDIAVKELGVQFKNSPKKLKKIFGWNFKSVIKRISQPK